MQLTLHSSFD